MSLGLEINETRFLGLLRNLIGESERLQNDPANGLIPKENLAIHHVLNALAPYLVENGGCITQEQFIYDEAQERGNLILGYKPDGWSLGDESVTFIGSHLDVVPANPDDWSVPPFELVIDGDTLHGRGTTDCLGHVALITEMFIQFAEKEPVFDRAVWAVFICSEESPTPGIGVDRLASEGQLERCRNGPCYWIDTSERQACIGCASTTAFSLSATGLTAHSGMPNQGINAIELADEALKFLQDKFFTDYPATEQEAEYGFLASSSMKPTQQEKTTGSVNQIPNNSQLNGDIRLTPFYTLEACMAKMKAYASEINEDPTILPTRGFSQYVITDAQGETVKGSIKLEYTGEIMKGIACNLESDGYKYLNAAITEVLGESKPYALTGSLPLVGDLQADGYDIQMTGFGYDAYYHADNECCSFDWMKEGLRIFSKILDNYVTTQDGAKKNLKKKGNIKKNKK